MTSKAVLLQQRQVSKRSIKTYTKTSNIKNCRRILKSREKSKDRLKKILPQLQRHPQRKQQRQLQDNRKDNCKDSHKDNCKDNLKYNHKAFECIKINYKEAPEL